jgi:hypothetical protein
MGIIIPFIQFIIHVFPIDKNDQSSHRCPSVIMAGGIAEGSAEDFTDWSSVRAGFAGNTFALHAESDQTTAQKRNNAMGQR